MTVSRNHLGLLVAVALCGACMAPHLGEPYGGFIAFSEAWYTLVATNYQDGSLLTPQVAPGQYDYNLPPLFGWMLHAGFSVFGQSDLVARVVAASGALLAVAVVAAIAGHRSALLLATTPAFVLLGRNVQPDMWSTTLALSSYLAWKRERPVISSLLFGLALLTKPTVLMFPAALALARAVERRHPFSWVRFREVAWAGLATLPTLAWLAVQFTVNYEPYVAGLRHGGGAFELPDITVAGILIREVVFAGFPLLTPLAAAAILLPRRATSGLRSPALAVVVVGLASFVLVHYHGYYLVALTPAVAVLAASILPRSRLLFATLVGVNVCASLIYLGGHKLGRQAIVGIAQSARGSRFLLAPPVYEGYWTVFARYGNPEAILRHPCVDGQPGSSVVIVPWPTAQEDTVHGYDRPMAFSFFGLAVAEIPLNPHQLAWGTLQVFTTSQSRLGYVETPQTLALHARRLPAGSSYCPARHTARSTDQTSGQTAGR